MNLAALSNTPSPNPFGGGGLPTNAPINTNRKGRLSTSERQTTRQKWIGVASQCGARLARASDPPLVRGGVMPAAADHTVIVRKEPDLLDVRRVPTMPVALPGTPSSVMDW